MLRECPRDITVNPVCNKLITNSELLWSRTRYCAKVGLFLFSWFFPILISLMLDDVLDSCGFQEFSHNTCTQTEENGSVSTQYHATYNWCNSSSQPLLGFYFFRRKKKLKFATHNSQLPFLSISLPLSFFLTRRVSLLLKKKTEIGL